MADVARRALVAARRSILCRNLLFIVVFFVLCVAAAWLWWCWCERDRGE